MLKMKKPIIYFFAGFLASVSILLILKMVFFVERPFSDGFIEDWEEICIWQDMDGMYASISPKGCYSSSCTRTKEKPGIVIVDLQQNEIRISSRFILLETSRFPFPCAKNCYGGGTIQFKLEGLIPNDYTLSYMNQDVGQVFVYSGRPTPRQCFLNQDQ